MGKKFWYKLSAAVVCCVMLLAMLPLAAMEVQADDEDTLKDLNSRYEELEAQQTELQNKIDQAKTEKEKQLAIKEKTASEISILKEQILSQLVIQSQKVVLMKIIIKIQPSLN